MHLCQDMSFPTEAKKRVLDPLELEQQVDGC